MKILKKIVSYILVAALASGLTFALCDRSVQPSQPSQPPEQTQPVKPAQQSKLDQLEQLILEKFIGDADKTAMEDAAADAMVNSLGDRWSYYIPASQFVSHMEQVENAYVGVGITILMLEEGGFLVQQVVPGGPAEEAGVLAGDILIAANGQDVTGMDANETSLIVKGEEGTNVVLTFLRDGKEIDITVERRKIQVVVATGQMLEGNIGLIQITNFDDRCSQETVAAIEKLLDEGAEKLIFDVRNNPGGYKHELVAVLDYLLPKGPLFRSIKYNGEETVDQSGSSHLDIPMAVLVNADSYSAAEFFAAAIWEYDAGIVVGQPTTGKGYFQSTYQLDDGSAVGLSVGKYYTPKGVSLADAGGFIPDVVVEVDEDMAFGIYAGTVTPEEDPQIQAAIDALNQP